MWLRPNVPSVKTNFISIAELWPNGENKDIVDLKHPIELSNWLDQFKGYTRGTKTYSWDRMKAEIRIEGGGSPSSYCKTSVR